MLQGSHILGQESSISHYPSSAYLDSGKAHSDTAALTEITQYDEDQTRNKSTDLWNMFGDGKRQKIKPGEGKRGSRGGQGSALY